jgi:hypothetical protein
MGRRVRRAGLASVLLAVWRCCCRPRAPQEPVGSASKSPRWRTIDGPTARTRLHMVRPATRVSCWRGRQGSVISTAGRGASREDEGGAEARLCRWRTARWSRRRQGATVGARRLGHVSQYQPGVRRPSAASRTAAWPRLNGIVARRAAGCRRAAAPRRGALPGADATAHLAPAPGCFRWVDDEAPAPPARGPTFARGTSWRESGDTCVPARRLAPTSAWLGWPTDALFPNTRSFTSPFRAGARRLGHHRHQRSEAARARGQWHDAACLCTQEPSVLSPRRSAATYRIGTLGHLRPPRASGRHDTGRAGVGDSVVITTAAGGCGSGRRRHRDSMAKIVQRARGLGRRERDHRPVRGLRGRPVGSGLGFKGFRQGRGVDALRRPRTSATFVHSIGAPRGRFMLIGDPLEER